MFDVAICTYNPILEHFGDRATFREFLMHVFVRHLFAVIAVLVIGVAQVAGVSRGYLCECFGVPVLTASPECDAAEYPSGHDDDGWGFEDEDHAFGEHGKPHRHQRVIETMKSIGFTPLVLGLPVAVELDLPVWMDEGVRIAAELAERCAEVRPPEDPGVCGQTDALAARSMVMLV